MSPSENRKQFLSRQEVQCRDIKLWVRMVPDLQVLPVRRRWGRRAASEALVPPTACRGSSHRGTPPSSHTNTCKKTLSQLARLKRCVVHKYRKKKKKSTRTGHHNRACVPHCVSLAGKYLLFYLLEGRLLDDTLHRLLLDGLCDLLLSQWQILQEGKRVRPAGQVRALMWRRGTDGVPSSPVTLVRIWPAAT